MRKLFEMLKIARPGKSTSVKKWTERFIQLIQLRKIFKSIKE